MDGIFEKFSVYDFFNLIIGGATFIVALHLIGFEPLDFLINDIKIPDNDVLALALILLICYIIGFEMQALGDLTENNENNINILINIFKTQDKMVRTLLCDNNMVIGNIEKLQVYRAKARELFEAKNIKVDGNNFSAEQCEYFFAYCIYFVQVNGQNKKTERMRGLKGLSNLWMVCFGFSFFIGLFYSGWLLFNGAGFEKIPFLSTIAFLLLAIVSYYMMKANIKKWIRMTLGTYEVCSDLANVF